MKTYYHVTTPERARKILREGFNCELNPNYHTNSSYAIPEITRVYLTRKGSIKRWIRILCKELGWTSICVLKVQFEEKVWRELRRYKDNMCKAKEPFISDWGDQLIFQFRITKQPPIHLEIVKEWTEKTTETMKKVFET